MFQRKTRRFRRRSSGRNHMHGNGSVHRIRPGVFSNGQQKNNFRSSLSAEKLLEKYTALAKEAMSTGDKTLSENYLQHADHFRRIIEDKNKSKAEVPEKTNETEKKINDISTDISNKDIKK